MLKRKKNTPDTDGQRTKKSVRRAADSGRTLSGQAPRWVTWFTDIGRPLSAIVVMVLCAPGERHLAELAGWGSTLSWGMAGLLVMYAGIAAVVATVRPKGAPGKRTAVLGAIVSLLLAMAAQPVSHYFVTGWMTAEPRPPFWLVTVVSCVPPFVMGHLLHLAADPGSPPDAVVEIETDDSEFQAAVNRASAAVDQIAGSWAPAERADTAPGPDAMHWHPEEADSGHVWSAADTSVQRTPDSGMRVADILAAGQPDTAWTDGRTADMIAYDRTDSYPSGYRDEDEVSGMYPDNVDPDMSAVERTDGQPDSGQSLSGLRPADIRRAADRFRTDSGHRTADDMSAFIRDTWALNPDMNKADMRTTVRRNFPDKGADAVRKAVTRAEEAIQR